MSIRHLPTTVALLLAAAGLGAGFPTSQADAQGAAQAAIENPFKTLAGSWNGSGQMHVENEKPENLKCKAFYTNRNGGADLGIIIRCASAANKIELRAKLVNSGGQLTGNWEESAFNVAGDVSGRANPGRINLSITGAIKGTMTVSYTGSQQTVTIATQGAALKGVSISLSRG